MPEPRAQVAVPPAPWLRAVVRLLGHVLCALYVAVALLGVLFMSPVDLLTVAPALGLAAACLLTGLSWFLQQPVPSRRTMILTACVAAAMVPFDEGTRVLQGLGTAIALTVLALAILIGQYHVYRLSAPAQDDRPRSGDSRSYAELLRVLALETVFHEWRAQAEDRGGPLGRAGSADAVQARALLLDEMQRRDPAGFGRWLDDGAVSPPEQHIRDDRDSAA